MERASISVTGMSCGHCVASVDRALRTLEGVKVEEVALGSARVAYDPGAISAEGIAAAIERAGYGAKIAGVGSASAR